SSDGSCELWVGSSRISWPPDSDIPSRPPWPTEGDKPALLLCVLCGDVYPLSRVEPGNSALKCPSSSLRGLASAVLSSSCFWTISWYAVPEGGALVETSSVVGCLSGCFLKHLYH